MKKLIKKILINAIAKAQKNKLLLDSNNYEIEIKEIKNPKFGDFSTNLAMKTAKIEKKHPEEIAKIIINNFDTNLDLIYKTEIVKPGFINFFINSDFWYSILKKIYKEDTLYGHNNLGCNQNIQIEFVSSNPTGPLHFGHGRGAVVGDTLSNILTACGYNVKKEYYINDFGRQISILGLSVYLRAKEYFDSNITMPKHCYQGNYIKLIAQELIEKEDTSLFLRDKIDEKTINRYATYALKKILKEIKLDLKKIGINFDSWFSEQSLYDTGKVEEIIDYYKNKKLIYEHEGALWFKSSKFGDEKDRVIVRNNGISTYFASDIAYHKNKFDRGFDQIINVWGSDHHGYIPRMKAIVESLGKKNNQFKVVLVKLVNLLRKNKKITMSTRTGDFITLKQVIDEVGRDAARFLFLTRHSNSSLDFDIEIAKKKNNNNPVYYVQYVHARISNILSKAKNKGIEIKEDSEININQIKDYDDINLIKKLSNYPEVIKRSCQLLEPHRLSFYLMELSSYFHAYYNKNRVISSNIKLTQARLYLIMAVSKVICNGLNLLGIKAPEKM